MCWEQWRDEKCVKGHSVDLSFRMSSTFDWKINTVWNGNIPFHWCPQRARLPPWVSEGLGTPSRELFWRQWLQQVAGEAIVEIWMCFPLGSPPGKDRKILVLSQLPYFFSSPFWERKPCKVCKEPYLLNVCLVCESYVSPLHTHTHRERGTLGSRNQPAQDLCGVLSLQASQPCLTQWGISLCRFHMSSEDSTTYLWFRSCVSTTLYCQKTMWARNGEPLGLLLCFTFSRFTLS